MIKLKKGELLVYAGDTALRAPNGTLLPSVPQFVILTAADPPAAATPLKKTERLIMAGQVFHEKKRAEERFAALKAGRESPPKEAGGTPLYVVEDAKNFNSAGFTSEDEKANAALAAELTSIFAFQMRAHQTTVT
ncbi:MAG: hypothetical protein FWC70_05530 [Defluviitaleaceae bacterium]|nr:hypothetical protein [Defluviitaleaceae bacterium]